MRTIDPENPLASNSDLIGDALKVLAEIEGPTQPLRELLEGIKGYEPFKDCEDDIEDAQAAFFTLKEFFETEDENLRDFTRDLNYIWDVLEELLARAIEESTGELRDRPGFFWDKPPPQEM